MQGCHQGACHAENWGRGEFGAGGTNLLLVVQVPMMAGRDEWMEEAMTKVSPKCSPTMVDSEHPLFLLYTSGSTGKPKGVRFENIYY